MAPYKTALVIPMSYEKVWTPEGRKKVGFLSGSAGRGMRWLASHTPSLHISGVEVSLLSM